MSLVLSIIKNVLYNDVYSMQELLNKCHEKYHYSTFYNKNKNSFVISYKDAYISRRYILKLLRDIKDGKIKIPVYDINEYELAYFYYRKIEGIQTINLVFMGD